VRKLNHYLLQQSRGEVYYNSLIMIADNLQVLTTLRSEGANASKLKLTLNYFKSMIFSSNTDKIKVLLDSRFILYLSPFLNMRAVREDLIGVF